MFPIVWLPRSLQRSLNAAADSLLNPPQNRRVDFASPRGEAALVSPDSVSWRVFKNPIALFVGGVAAVVMELAEPSIRAGIWEQSSFRKDPMGRLRRTGSAAMTTVYGARSVAESMIAGIVRRHAKVVGTTHNGVSYSASDEALLNWVHTTAAYGFVNAYSQYVAHLTADEVDGLFREAVPSGDLYGAINTPVSITALTEFFAQMAPRLEASPIIFEFLQIMRMAPAFPKPLRWMQPVLVRAAVDILPQWLRERLGLGKPLGLRAFEIPIAKCAGALADRIVLPDSPASQACVRLGLPITHLYTGLSYKL
jgi:uncharacterized protein (DUF2236 family)